MTAHISFNKTNILNVYTSEVFGCVEINYSAIYLVINDQLAHAHLL